MIVLGLTGSIGMGKSTAARMLRQMGCGIYDSDLGVHKAISPTGKAFEAVTLTFPDCWDKRGHVINRQILGDIVFKDLEARQKLEAILHPIIEREQHAYIKQQTLLGRDFVVLDIPLLFETGAQERVDYTLVVTAPDFVQQQRVMARTNMTLEKFKAILKTQMPDTQKCALADFVIPTGLGMAHSYNILKRILESLK